MIITPRSRKALVVGFIILCLLLIAMAVFAPSSVHYTVEGFSYESGVEHLELRWQSSHPYPSVVQIERQGEAPRKIGQGGSPVTSHSVRIDGLQEEETVVVRIVFPDGRRSLPQSVSTSPFQVEIIGLSEGVLSWRTIPPSWGRIWIREKGSDTLREASARLGDDGIIRATVASLSPLVSEIIMESETDETGTITSSMSTMVEEQTRGMLARLTRFDPEEIFEGMYDVLEGSVADKVTREFLEPEPGESEEAFQRRRDVFVQGMRHRQELRRKEAEDELLERVRTIPSLDDYRRLRDLAPLVLGTRLLDFDLRCALFERLEAFVGLWLFAAFGDLPLTPLEPLPTMGTFSLSGTPIEEYDGRQVILAPSDETIHLGIGTGLERRTRHATWDERFESPDPATLQSLQMVVQFDNFRNSVLRFRLNRRYTALLYGAPLLEGFDRGGEGVLVKSIPLEALVEGSNLFEISVRELFGRLSRRRIRVDAVEFRWRNLPRE